MLEDNRKSFVHAGKKYTELVASFNNFVTALQSLQSSIPSLEFLESSPIQINFTFLGCAHCLRLRMKEVDGRWIGTIRKYHKEELDDARYSFSEISLFMDKHGNTGEAVSSLHWSIRDVRDVEEAFYHLLGAAYSE